MFNKILLAGVAVLSVLSTAHAGNLCMRSNPPLDNGKAFSGLLNVREKPDAKSKVLMQIPTGIILRMNTSIEQGWETNENWAYVNGGVVTYGEEDDQIVEGWVSKKYLKPIECPKLSEPEPEFEPELSPGFKPDNSPMTDDVLEDWCKRNDPNLTAQSCIELKSKTHIKRECYPKWVGLNRC
jgi:hypothetical protein